MGLADVRELIQDDMERELCQIVVNRINSHMEKENGEST